ncbi:MAG: hypothetical protein RLO12_20250 [Fulvivirga sp.]
MDKILNKWYFGLVIIPIIINYLTEVIQLPVLLNNWYITSIVTLSILSLILVYELYKANQRVQQPTSRDKKIVTELLQTLDINNIQEQIINQDSWNGYRKDAIHNLLNFTHKAELISFKPTSKNLDLLISDLNTAVKEFSNYSSTQLYNDNDHFYTPDKKTEMGVKKAKEVQPIMNAQTDVILKKLTILMDYLRSNQYLD